ncbi:PAS domain-containing protein [Fusobacterium simiae]|uniref:helix-turn-helix transcriptional regulator n=1 Tax=Fusobacterium simiae TaxID=855 RepID=UPI0020C4360C|nr:PAS domain-containing protein [Fusobacterium simiae]MDC7955528.1 PAS domain-containing protein [Fusobacterium simiae]
MRNELLNQYKILVNFLGKTLGPSFEIVLHEIKGEEIKMIAIANGEISNRTLEDSISSETLNILKNKSYHNEEGMVNHTVLLKNGKKVRSSSMFIKENQKIIGMLCINFDDSKFHEINCQILRIIHPDMFVKNYLSDVSYNVLLDENKNQNDEENSSDNIETLMEKIFYEVNLKFNYPLERLTKKERETIVEALYEKGLFNLKDAINFVAKKLFCSPTTIYRYVGKIEKK